MFINLKARAFPCSSNFDSFPLPPHCEHALFCFFSFAFMQHNRWFHHSAYITFFGWLCHSGYSVGIMTTMPLEVPTMILSLGRVFPQYRQDLAFGLSFFVFRIVYHSWLTYHW